MSCPGLYKAINIMSSPDTVIVDRIIGNGKILMKTSIQRGQFFLSSDQNGLVRSVTEGFLYNSHLVLRPDDIWLGIMAQLNALSRDGRGPEAQAFRGRLFGPNPKPEVEPIQ